MLRVTSSTARMVQVGFDFSVYVYEDSESDVENREHKGETARRGVMGRWFVGDDQDGVSLSLHSILTTVAASQLYDADASGFRCVRDYTTTRTHNIHPKTPQTPSSTTTALNSSHRNHLRVYVYTYKHHHSYLESLCDNTISQKHKLHNQAAVCE